MRVLQAMMGNEFKGRAAHSAEHFGDTPERRRALASRQNVVRGLDDATYHGITGGGFYLVAGRKPA